MIVWLASALFSISLWLLVATWLLYPIALRLLVYMHTGTARAPVIGAPRRLLTVLVAVHNEEASIDKRISNILESCPADFDLEILVGSDGSTDGTVPKARAWANRDLRVRMFETIGARGKAVVHNEGVPMARGDIIVFTDAATEFAACFLDVLGHAFDDPKVGFATGALVWRNPGKSMTGESFSLYWRFEAWLRELETHLGIHALGSGACSAVRRHLYRPINATADQDFITPLDAILQGYRCVYVSDAVAYEYVNQTAMSEFKARVRMTAKNFSNTFTHWGGRSFIERPAVSTGLIFHKLLRWLTPYLFAMMVGAGLFLLWTEAGDRLTTLIVLGSLGTMLYGCLGAVEPRLPLAGALWSFMIANAAFAVGIYLALSGRAPTAY